jgi:predicted DNA-binding antitoxin AbrB/MazE fold protein
MRGDKMTLHIEAVYDGKAFVPTEPIKLRPNSRVRIAVETEEERPASFLEVAQSLQLDGPPDWSTNLDEYLYGGKRVNGT